MFLSHLRLVISIVLIAGISCNPSTSESQSYPSKPLSFLVPWAVGGGTDLSSRILANALETSLGQRINVINRAGGSGVVGHLALSKARADGYTIGAITGEITMMHWMKLTELTASDYVPLALTMNNPAAVTIREDAPWNSIEELVAAIRKQPGEIQASGTSRGGIWDLARIGFLKANGLPSDAMPWVPSKGSAPALQELIADGVQVVTASLAEVAAMKQAGQVRVLAVMADQRLNAFPDIPTLKEQGIDWSIGGWVGVGAPKELPEPVRLVLDSAIREAVKSPAYIQAMDQAGYNRQYLDANEFGPFLKEMDQINGELMSQAGLAR